MKKLYLFAVIFSLLFSCPISAHEISGVLPCNTTLTLNESPYHVTSSIIVDNGCVLTVEPGVEIQMSAEAYMIVKGKVNFAGSASQPIHIHAFDTSWRHIFIDNSGQKSIFNFVIIEDATHGPNGNAPNTTHQIGAISGLHAPGLEIKNCVFRNNMASLYAYGCENIVVQNCTFDSTNLGEKILIQYSDNALVDNNVFYFTAGSGDAIDIDVSDNVMVSNNHIYGGDSDGIDLGQRDSTGCKDAMVTKNFIFNMGDKAISCGELCTVSLYQNVMAGCDVGICSKAGSIVKADHNTMYQNRIGVKSIKEGGWGSGDLTVSNCIIAGSTDSTLFKDASSALTISYSLSDKDLPAGTGNIMGNPLFVSPGLNAASDFHLNNNSPAINAGDPSFPLDQDGSRTDMGAFNSAPLSLKENYLAGPLKIYPNPSRGEFWFNNPVFNGQRILVKIFSSSGQLVYSENLDGQLSENGFNIHLNEQSPGIFFLQVISGELVITNKVVIE